MFEVIVYAFNAIMPLLLLILFGFWLGRRGVLDEPFIKKLNSFAFTWLLSTQLFYSTYNIGSFSGIPWGPVIFAVLYVLFLFLVSLPSVRVLTPDDRRRSVLSQAFFRSNIAVLGIELATLLGGQEAAGVVAVLMAFVVIVNNISSVFSFTLFSPGQSASHVNVKKLLSDIEHNAMIRGLAAALLCLLIRGLLPKGADGSPIFTIRRNLPFLYTAIGNVSKAASPILLILLGARFQLSDVASMRRELSAGVLIRIVFAPALGFFLLWLLSGPLGLFTAPPAVFQAMLAVLASPCATTSTVMAAEMGGDDRFAGQLVVWSSIFSMGTMFLFIVVLRGLGLM